MLVGPILGVIIRERKLINNGLKGKTNLCSWLFIKYNVGGPLGYTLYNFLQSIKLLLLL